VAKFKDKMDEREGCRILGMTKNTEKKEKEKYYQRNGYANEEVETLGAEER
jgi:hypothetical protein